MERIVPSNLPDPPCGILRYYADPKDPPQIVESTYELGDPVVRFQDMEEEDAGETFDPREMDGTFEKIS
jgi:hypothetical protein